MGIASSHSFHQLIASIQPDLLLTLYSFVFIIIYFTSSEPFKTY
jgi:hypothetical protein